VWRGIVCPQSLLILKKSKDTLRKGTPHYCWFPTTKLKAQDRSNKREGSSCTRELGRRSLSYWLLKTRAYNNRQPLIALVTDMWMNIVNPYIPGNRFPCLETIILIEFTLFLSEALGKISANWSPLWTCLCKISPCWSCCQQKKPLEAGFVRLS